jgi:hypothetical protein
MCYKFKIKNKNEQTHYQKWKVSCNKSLTLQQYASDFSTSKNDESYELISNDAKLIITFQKLTNQNVLRGD